MVAFLGARAVGTLEYLLEQLYVTILDWHACLYHLILTLSYKVEI